MANSQLTVTHLQRIDPRISCLRYAKEARNCWLHLPTKTWLLLAARGAHPVNCCAHLAEESCHLSASISHKNFQLLAAPIKENQATVGRTTLQNRTTVCRIYLEALFYVLWRTVVTTVSAIYGAYKFNCLPIVIFFFRPQTVGRQLIHPVR